MTDMVAQANELLLFLAGLFIFVLGLMVLMVSVLFVVDITQSKHAIRRNFPVIGRFRYWFEHLGEFFRQYFFAMDREEMPFNRAERSWVYRAAKGRRRDRGVRLIPGFEPDGHRSFRELPLSHLGRRRSPRRRGHHRAVL